MKRFGLNYGSELSIQQFWRDKMVITKRKLTKAEEKERGLSYDGWGQKPNGIKEYYYYKK